MNLEPIKTIEMQGVKVNVMDMRLLEIADDDFFKESYADLLDTEVGYDFLKQEVSEKEKVDDITVYLCEDMGTFSGFAKDNQCRIVKIKDNKYLYAFNIGTNIFGKKTCNMAFYSFTLSLMDADI